MTTLHPWIVTATIDGDELYFRTPPAAQIGFHRADEVSAASPDSPYSGDMIITADTVQIARLEGCTAVYATPSRDIAPARVLWAPEADHA